jgi:hypothetical protein
VPTQYLSQQGLVRSEGLERASSDWIDGMAGSYQAGSLEAGQAETCAFMCMCKLGISKCEHKNDQIRLDLLTVTCDMMSGFILRAV